MVFGKLGLVCAFEHHPYKAKREKMREIKFRYWDPFNAEMIYSESHVTLESFFAFYETAEQFGNGVILMQYTGLMDKNGREIFEGDIVKVVKNKINPGGIDPNETYTKIIQVIWDETSTGFNPFNFSFHYDNIPEGLTVIGNIYETAEKEQN